MVSIFEPPQRNSGIIGGKFLEATRISKPNSDVENPQYYGPGDFAIGATIQGLRFNEIRVVPGVAGSNRDRNAILNAISMV